MSSTLARQQNKHGLTRDIPAGVCRQLRQEAGFGCVICGAGIYQYEHIAPDFADAKTHDPEAMALLCPNCHQNVTSQRWSKSKVLAAKAEPFNLRHGTTRDFLDLAYPVSVRVGTTVFTNFSSIVSIDGGADWFTIEPPEDGVGPPLINCKFYSVDGTIDLEIVNNEWIAYTDSWDITFIGKTLTVNRKAHDIALRLIFNPPNGLVIDRMHLRYYGNSFRVDSNKIKFIVGGTSVDLETSDFNCGQSVFRLPRNMLQAQLPPDRSFRYAYQCERCGTMASVWVTWENRHGPGKCMLCGGATHLLPSAPAIVGGETRSTHQGSVQHRASEPEKPPNLILEDCSFADSPVGIKLAPGDRLSATRTTMRNVTEPIKLS